MKQEFFNNKAKVEDYQRQPKQLGLYEASHEHDACGVGMLVNIQGGKSHELVESALKVLENMRHRGAEGADIKYSANCSSAMLNKVYVSPVTDAV